MLLILKAMPVEEVRRGDLVHTGIGSGVVVRTVLSSDGQAIEITVDHPGNHRRLHYFHSTESVNVYEQESPDAWRPTPATTTEAVNEVRVRDHL